MKKNNKVGLSKLNKQKRLMTIINYNNYHDIDIIFEDGVIVTGRDIREFNRGGIVHPADKNYKARYIGQKNTNTQGRQMEIIDYIQYSDITVKFDDGQILEHAQVRDFLKGQLRHPDDKNYLKKNNIKISQIKNKRIGEKSTNKQGLEMTILNYRKSNDLDVIFEDGEIKKGVAYKEFKNGSINHPKSIKGDCISLNETVFLYYLQNFGFKRINRNELFFLGNMGLDLYNSNLKIGIEYDGYPWHKNKERDLLKNKKCFENGIQLIRIREPNCPILKDKLSKNIYLNSNTNFSIDLLKALNEIKKIIFNISNVEINLDINFDRDKNNILDLYNKYSYNSYALKRIGESKVNTKGRIMEIIDYRGYNQIDIRFDDGIVLTNMSYDSFKKGEILHPDDLITKEKREGIRRKNKHGDWMEIVSYKNANNIDIKFDDGSIRKNQKYANFKTGAIVRSDQLANPKNRVGMENFNTQRKKMKIIAYRRNNDIDVQFEDGVIKKHCTFGNFKVGHISHPKDSLFTKIEDRIGETSINKRGRVMKIIEYYNYDNITIKFEDGTIKEKCHYHHFKSGNIKHPKDKVLRN